MTTYQSMQTNNRKGFVPVAGSDQRSPHLTHYPGKTGETIAAGDFVTVDSNKIARATASSTGLAGVAANGLDAHGNVAVYDDPDQLFTGRLDGTTSYGAGHTCDIAGGSGAQQIDANADAVHQLVLVSPVNPSEDHAAIGAQWTVRIQNHLLCETSS